MNNIIPENVCLERSEENSFNIFDACRNDEQQLHRNDALEDVNIGFKKLPRTLLLQLDNCGSENKN